MGASFDIMHFTPASRPTEFLERKQIEIWATDTSGTPLESANAPVRLAIAVGNEGAGLSPSIRARAQHNLTADRGERRVAQRCGCNRNHPYSASV